MDQSDGYNPFEYIRSDNDIIKLVTNMMKNTTPKGSAPSDPFWDNALSLYLQAIMSYVWYECPKQGKKANIREMMDLLAGYKLRASGGMRKKIDVLSQQLEAYAGRRVMTDPTAAIDLRRMELDHLRERLISAQVQKNGRSRQRFVSLTASLEAMSPLRVLTRGYTIASDFEGSCIRSVDQLRKGDRIRLRLCDGGADCLVEDVERN